MYKRKKRRATKGKKKLSIAATTSSSSPSATRTTSELSIDELVQNGETTETSDNMSVTTMEVAEEGEQQQQQQVQPQRPSLDQTTSNNHNNNKAVGARKRKPMQISKIVDKLPPMNDHPIDFGAEKNLIHNNNNNNNSPPYKKPCLELSKNGMIKNILSELKTAKMGGGNNNNNKGDTPMTRRLYERDEDDEDDDDEEEDERSEDETLRIKVDDDEDDDEEEEGIDYSGNEDAKFVHNKRNNLYNVSPSSSSSSSSSFKDRYGAGSSMKDHHHQQQDREGSSHNNRIERTKRSILSNNMIIHKNINNIDNTGFKSPGKSRVSSPNGWDRNVLLDKGDIVKDEGTDLRSVNGNSAGDDDDELPFRCGACTYSSCDKSTLIRHLRIHSGERPFQCRLCYFAFTTKANCERHLRNRHGQQIDSREQLRDLVVCLPTSSNASESETEMNSNGGGAQPQSYPSMALVESIKRRGSNGSGMLVAEENELPLDLSMDAVDLSTHSKQRDGGNSIFRRKASLPRPRPMYAANEMSNSLVTSPFISKREPQVHPQLQLNSFTSHPIASQTQPVIGAHPNHPAFSLFPFGGPPGFNPFVIPTPTNVEKLMGLRSSSPTKLSNYITASPKGSFENLVSRDPISAEKESKIKVEPATESKRSGSNSKSASSSVSPTTSSRKRADNNTNGDGYQKPKQRRYRTERPYSCPFCPARFTLRSNMERHGKHQHPTVWVRSPSNRVINRQKNQQQLSPLVGSPTLVQPNKKYNSNNSIGADNSNKDKSNKDSAVNVNVRAVIAQQLKRKLSNSSLRNNNNGSETETDPENTPVHDSKNSGDPDLASVSQLLDRVKNSNFAQYFNEAENHNFNNDNNNSDEELEGDESGEEDGLSDERSADEGDSKTSGGVEKKKSAYSSSPHKISCPHCPRKFPWTSSLRRHLLTHSGVKPYQCSKCPLLFTTKSNCDRHLARKHSGNNNNSNSNSKESDSNNSSEDEDEGEEDENEESVDGRGEETNNNNNNSSSNNNNNNSNDGVVENSEKSTSNLLKTPTVNCGTPTVTNSNSSSPGEDAAFRCHLCEASAGEREALLTHMEEQHHETFHLLLSKGALSSSPQSENSENEQVPLDQKDVTHRKVMCVFCVRRFWSVEDLRRHIRSHSGERPFSCTHCNRRFTLKHSMLRHLKKHSTSVTPSRKLAKASKEQTDDLVSGTGATSSGKNNGDLIGRLLGIKDDHIEQLLSSDAKNAEKLLGLEKQQHAQQTRATSKVN